MVLVSELRCHQPATNFEQEVPMTEAGYILKEDAELIISDAVNSPVGTAVPLPIP